MNREAENKTLNILVSGKIIRLAVAIPVNARGLIIFSHFFHSPQADKRHFLVARVLNRSGFATAMLNLPEFAAGSEGGIDAVYISAVIKRLGKMDELKDLPVGIFATSSGIVPAIKYAGENRGLVKAVVTRGAVPSGSVSDVNMVSCPILSITGEFDIQGREQNALFFSAISGDKSFATINGASWNFAELGKLGEVSHLASIWFEKNLSSKIKAA